MNENGYCTHGHLVDGENVVVRHGKERCRTCEREHGARYRAKKRALLGELQGVDPHGASRRSG